MKKVYIAPKVTVFVTTIHPLCVLSGTDSTDKATGEKKSGDLGNGGEVSDYDDAASRGRLPGGSGFSDDDIFK